MNTCTIPHPLALNVPAPAPTAQPRPGISPRRLIGGAFKLIQKLLEDRFPNWSHVRHQARWERKWARPDYQPFWRTEEPQKEFVEAISSGWLPKDRWVYDIGCGAGESSYWLSEQGLHTLGLDFSAAAIDLCRRLITDGKDNLRFEVVDMCADEMPLEPTAALIDRGCFHQIAEHFRPAYVQSAARLTEPGGHFLLLAATYQRDGYRNNRHACSEADLAQQVEQLFRQYFTIERTEPTTINTTDGGEGMPAVAFWMVRHESGIRAGNLLKQLLQSEPSRTQLVREADLERAPRTAEV